MIKKLKKAEDFCAVVKFLSVMTMFSALLMLWNNGGVQYDQDYAMILFISSAIMVAMTWIMEKAFNGAKKEVKRIYRLIYQEDDKTRKAS